MRLRTLWVKDFGCFRDFSCTFAPGLNWLVGPNGSGKTTILEALDLVLYSTNISNRALAIHTDANKAEIQCEFDLDVDSETHTFDLRRVWYRNGNTTAILQDRTSGQTLSGIKTIREYLEPHFGNSGAYKLWYLRQGELFNVLTLLEQHASIEIEWLYGFKRLDSIEKSFLDTLGERCPFSLSEFLEQKARLQTLRTLLQDAQAELQTLRANLVSEQAVEQMRQRRDALLQRIGEVKIFLSSTNRYEDLVTLQAEYKKLMEQSEVLQKEVMALEEQCPVDIRGIDAKRLRVFLNHLEEYQKIRAEHNRLCEQIQMLWNRRPPSVARKCKQLMEQVAALKKHISNLQTCLTVLQGTDTAVCPVCEQPVSVDLRPRLEARLQDARQQFMRVEADLNYYVQREQKRSKVRKDLHALVMQAKNFRYQLQHNGGKLLPYLDVLQKLYDLKIQQTKIQDSIAALTQAIAVLQTAFKEWNVASPADVQKWQHEADDLERQIQAAMLTLSKYRNLEQQIADLTSQLREQELRVNQLARLERLYKYCSDFFKQFVAVTRQTLRTYFNENILAYTNALLAEIESGFQLFLSDEGVIRVQTSDGHLLPISRLSYGQRLMLAFTISFVLYLASGSRTIFLADEPTAGLDANNVANFVKLCSLLMRANQQDLQFIIATHEAHLVSDQSNVIMVEHSK